MNQWALADCLPCLETMSVFEQSFQESFCLLSHEPRSKSGYIRAWFYW